MDTVSSGRGDRSWRKASGKVVVANVDVAVVGQKTSKWAGKKRGRRLCIGMDGTASAGMRCTGMGRNATAGGA